MDWYNITSLIISILSLIATVAISFVIFVLEGKRQKKIEEIERKRIIEYKAKEFIQNNDSEKEFLSLAQFAHFLNPLYKHKRKIFNEFNRCEHELQKEILRLLNFTDLKLEKYNKETFIDDLLNKFEKKAKELQLYTDSFLYDGAKYFHRGFYNWGEMRINGNYDEDKNNNENFQNYYDEKYYHVNNNFYSRQGENDIWLRLLDYIELSKCKSDEEKEEYYKRAQYASSILDDKVPVYAYEIPETFSEFMTLHKIKPLDYYWLLVTECAESECTYIVMEMVKNSALIINRVYNKEWKIALEGDYQIERSEDLYYETIYILYAVFADKIKFK